MKKIKTLLEEKGFTVKKYGDEFELQQYTPAGEDWHINLDKLEDIVEYAEDFDPEEEFEIWYEAGRNGVGGVPKITELWKDQLWKQELLNSIAKELK